MFPVIYQFSICIRKVTIKLYFPLGRNRLRKSAIICWWHFIYSITYLFLVIDFNFINNASEGCGITIVTYIWGVILLWKKRANVIRGVLKHEMGIEIQENINTKSYVFKNFKGIKNHLIGNILYGFFVVICFKNVIAI